jgi:peptidoglycan hydrolase CwlO-like protein
VDRLHQEVKDKDTQLSTERLKFDYEKEELQKLLTEQKQAVREAKLDVGKARGEMDRLMEEKEEERNRLTREMATLRDDLVR